MITFIKFYAQWCAPCKAMTPIIDALKEEYRDRVIFVDVDIDENPAYRKDMHVQSVPTFIAAKDGTVIDRRVGSATSAEIKEFIDGILGTIQQ